MVNNLYSNPYMYLQLTLPFSRNAFDRLRSNRFPSSSTSSSGIVGFAFVCGVATFLVGSSSSEQLLLLSSELDDCAVVDLAANTGRIGRADTNSVGSLFASTLPPDLAASSRSRFNLSRKFSRATVTFRNRPLYFSFLNSCRPLAKKNNNIIFHNIAQYSCLYIASVYCHRCRYRGRQTCWWSRYPDYVCASLPPPEHCRRCWTRFSAPDRWCSAVNYRWTDVEFCSWWK